MNALLDGLLTVLLAVSAALNVALLRAWVQARATLLWLAGPHDQPLSLPERALLRIGEAEHAQATTLTFPRVSD